MRIGIIGYGLEGQAAYDYWKDKGEVTICDQNSILSLPDNITAQLGDNYLDDLSRFDLIVRSPIVKPDTILRSTSTDIKSKLTSNTNEFLRICPTANIIGVTGTKGKGTTSTLIARLLEAAGKKVHLGGNIGIPPLELLKNNIAVNDWVVLELSSFQLIDCRYSPHIGVCLMVVPEHLDWHNTIDEYIHAKAQLFRRQTEKDIAIYLATNELSHSIVSAGSGQKIPYMNQPGAIIEEDRVSIDGQTICTTDSLGLAGKHNWQNVCAALTAVWQITQNKDVFRQVLQDFKGLEHRLELVGRINDVTYYDDSFGTTPETAIVAMETFNNPKILILGGSDKGADYNLLAQAIQINNVKQVLLIGQQANRIQAALDAVGFHAYQPGGQNMQTIVQTAAKCADPGDLVLLSPACASFGMFANYKDRGDQFKAAVKSLGS